MPQKDPNTEIIKYVVLIGAAYYIVLKPILQKFGISKTQEEEAAAQNITQVETAIAQDNPFSGRSFLKGYPKGTILLTTKSANSLANALRNSFTIFGDNETKAIGIFRQLRTKAQVAMLADTFYKKYNLDLWTFLRNGTPYGGFLTAGFSGLNDKELNMILNIVNKLPKYK